MSTESQFRFDSKDLDLLRSVLNEVLNGLYILDFEERIGIKMPDAEELLERLHYHGTLNTASLDISCVRAFRSALFETITELGTEEFQTRTGYDLDEGNALLERLDQILHSSDQGANRQA